MTPSTQPQHTQLDSKPGFAGSSRASAGSRSTRPRADTRRRDVGRTARSGSGSRRRGSRWPARWSYRPPTRRGLPAPSAGAQQSLADLPGGRVPQIRRAVVNSVVVHIVTDHEARSGERGWAGPTEAHPLVAGHVDDETSRQEGAEVVSWRKVNGASVSCSTQLTTMSFSARNGASATRPSSVTAQVRLRSSESWSRCTICTE